MPGSTFIPRTALVSQLCGTADRVVAILAPAGFGKSTLLSQWDAADVRPFAHVRLRRHDNLPGNLMEHIARELDLSGTAGHALRGRVRRPSVNIISSALPALLNAFRSAPSPFVLALDDVHLIENADCLDVIAALAMNVPAGSVVAVAGRGEQGLPLAKLRASRRLDEYDAADLALDTDEGTVLVRQVVGDLPEPVARAHAERCEGWPVGLYLTALALRSGPSGMASIPVGGDDRFVHDYVRSEILARLPAPTQSFLICTAVLPSMCAELCDVVVGRPGSQQVLESIERSNHLLIPLDRQRRWYRYHDLFREALEAELHASQPESVTTLRRAALQWYVANGYHEEAFLQAMEVGDRQLARETFATLVLPVFYDGRLGDVIAWVERFGDELAAGDQTLATVSAWVGIVTGDPGRTERWARIAEREFERNRRAGLPPSWIPYGTLRAHWCPDGVAAMLRDANQAMGEVSVANPWRLPTQVVHAVATGLAGDRVTADQLLEDAAVTATATRAPMALLMAVGWRAHLATARGDWAGANRHVDVALRVATEHSLQEIPFCALTFATAARCAARRGDRDAARQHVIHTQRVLPLLTRALPWWAVATRLQVAHTLLMVDDLSGAQAFLADIDAIQSRVADLGTLDDLVAELRRTIGQFSGRGELGISSLTAAELRLLPYLPTHYSFREIGRRLYVTESTVKTQVGSIYRKFAVNSRAEAVETATRVGLLER